MRKFLRPAIVGTVAIISVFTMATTASASTATLGPVVCASSTGIKIVIKTSNTSKAENLIHFNSNGDSRNFGPASGNQSTITSRSSSSWIAGSAAGMSSISYGCTL